MRLIGLAVVLAVIITVVPLAMEAQQTGKVARIGILHIVPPDTSGGFAALQQGLRSLGYTEGQNIALDYRWPPRPEQLSASATELLRLKVNIIVTANERTAAAAKRATNDIPIRPPFWFSTACMCHGFD